MLFTETRGNDGRQQTSVTFSEAILNPMASFGGLYSPESLPQFDADFLASHVDSNYAQLSLAVLTAFDIDIESEVIERALALYEKFDDPKNPVPVVKVRDDLYVSELYHGPTRAFKDMALQPFGVVLSALAQQRDEQYLILAATSGDTGPAALETFKNRDNVRVACLYPDGGTSDVQRLQMVTENAPNLKVIGIEGSFDDAQHALKQLLNSTTFNEKLKHKGIALSAANSVNFGRIIFQIIYHIHSYLELVRQGAIRLGDNIYLNVPSGNFGNALGGFYAWKMGLPVEKIIVSSNANNVLTELIKTGRYDLTARQLIATTSPAMDILISSNIERILFNLFGAERTRELMQTLADDKSYQLSDDELPLLQHHFVADFCGDEEGKRYIKQAFDSGYLMDPHTATCFKSHETCREKPLKSVIYSTAEWTKFSPVIDNALTGNDDTHDIDALKSIAKTAGIEIPSVIRELFDKEIAQGSVIDKQDIETEILSFLD
jgi:threonine synthase